LFDKCRKVKRECQLVSRSGIFQIAQGPPEYCSSGGPPPSFAEMLLIEHMGKTLMGFFPYTLSFPVSRTSWLFLKWLFSPFFGGLFSQNIESQKNREKPLTLSDKALYL